MSSYKIKEAVMSDYVLITFVLKHLSCAFTLMWSQVKTSNIAMFIHNVLSVIL